MTDRPIALYVHLPWCLQKCPYCDFNSHTLKSHDSTLFDHYTQCLVDDLRYQVQHFELNQQGLLTSIFFGGGTPSLFSAKHIQQLIETALKHLPPATPTIEVSLEVNPGSLEHHRLADYHQAGVNRLSIGAQSFQNQQLQLLGRIHSDQAIHNTLKEAIKAGFEHLNVDLMYALPKQNLALAKRDLELALDYPIDHLSYYQLTIEPNTRFQRHPPQHLPDHELTWRMQQQAEALLHDHGFEQYETSAWAKSPWHQHACQHNLNYWRFGDYLGIGAGAHGKISGAAKLIQRSQHAQSPNRYMQAIQQQQLPTIKPISPAQLPMEFALNQLRLHEPFKLSHFRQKTGLDSSQFTTALEQAKLLNLIHFEPPLGPQTLIQTSSKGRLFLNDLQALFIAS